LLGAASNYGNRQYDAEYRQTNNDVKERLVVARTNAGNTSQFNPQMNVTLSKVDSDRENNRLWAPSSVIQSGPSVQTYGKTSNSQYINDSYGTDRISPDLLTAFKENPYTHSLTNAV
jgi:hypothetical protein